MLIDESKMTFDSFFSFLNHRKQHTNLKLRILFKTENITNLHEQNRSTKTYYDQPIQIVDTTAIAQFRSHTLRLHKPTTDTHSWQNCLQN